MFGARFAVFVRRARVLPSPCPATRNLSFLMFHRHRHPVVSTRCFSGMVRVCMKIPQDGNRANVYRHVLVVHGIPFQHMAAETVPKVKQCKACAKHAHAPRPRVCACLRDFHLVEFSRRPVLSQLNNDLKQQGDGAGETSRTTNYELHGTGWATRAPVAQTLQTVRQTCLCTAATCPYLFARFPSCGIFTSTRTSPVKQRVETTG